jgi:hypothetical protein
MNNGTISSNFCYDNGVSGISLRNVHNVSVMSNRCSNIDGTRQDYGIREYDSGADYSTDNFIINNDVRNNQNADDISYVGGTTLILNNYGYLTTFTTFNVTAVQPGFAWYNSANSRIELLESTGVWKHFNASN